MTLPMLISKLKNFPTAAKKELEVILTANEQDFEEMQRTRIAKGKDAEGDALKFLNERSSKVGKAYTIPYERKKRKAGGRTDIVDLNLENELMDSIFAKAKKNILDIKFDDPNKGKLKGISNNYKEPLGFDDKQEVQVEKGITKDLETWGKTYFEA